MPFRFIKGVIFFQKLKISEIWNLQFVAGPMRSLYTKNQLIPTIRLWLLFFSGEKVVPKSQRENRKKLPFLGQKSANFQNFSKIIWKSIKHIEIHIWYKFQLNWTFFRHFMAIFNPHFVLFYIYNGCRSKFNPCLRAHHFVNFYVMNINQTSASCHGGTTGSTWQLIFIQLW